MPELLLRKKWQGAIIATLLAYGGFYLGFSIQEVLVAISPFVAAIGAQGIADIGKEKALIEYVFDGEDMPDLPQPAGMPRKIIH